ncbi:hypothetical protein Mp_8g02880 [Marchantia polymorpha subsp. ruderalis]|uniref:Uncharacterized protein n=1 Tax=Marchantia polymorpha TaxID=3197 RepID=A0A2R6XJ37_MARPO|nr:hypothetical protein MARPO_0012s0081 [Marchantia polymorpha]BBN18484.1 hypothetical protein Mp_8g02880 [Marchantia polymorpha subsp. ruderalis]|eukprot:PTQ46128.1 hypothetical protein MARPO_0012s0081 [Marchantia polymorpha]
MDPVTESPVAGTRCSYEKTVRMLCSKMYRPIYPTMPLEEILSLCFCQVLFQPTLSPQQLIYRMMVFGTRQTHKDDEFPEANSEFVTSDLE